MWACTGMFPASLLIVLTVSVLSRDASYGGVRRPLKMLKEGGNAAVWKTSRKIKHTENGAGIE